MEAFHLVAASFERVPWGWYVAGVITLALIKAWPILAKQATEARIAIRVADRTDLHDCNTRLDELTRRIDISDERAQRAEDRAHRFEMQLLGTLAAYRILDRDIAAKFPDSAALRNAREVMSATFSVSPSTGPGEERNGKAPATTGVAQ